MNRGGRTGYARGGRGKKRSSMALPPSPMLDATTMSRAAKPPMMPGAEQMDEQLPIKMQRPAQRMETAAASVPPPPAPGEDMAPADMAKRGGRPHRREGGSYSPPHMTGGSGSGTGRLEKAEHLDYCEGGRR
jgi:hypothetical protein